MWPFLAHLSQTLRRVLSWLRLIQRPVRFRLLGRWRCANRCAFLRLERGDRLLLFVVTKAQQSSLGRRLRLLLRSGRLHTGLGSRCSSFRFWLIGFPICLSTGLLRLLLHLGERLAVVSQVESSSVILFSNDERASSHFGQSAPLRRLLCSPRVAVRKGKRCGGVSLCCAQCGSS